MALETLTAKVFLPLIFLAKVLSTNIATVQAFEGYLQHLITSPPKASLVEGLKQ